MAPHISYVVETNGENGVNVVYYPLETPPHSIEWIIGVNSFGISQNLPDPEDYNSPEYVRKADFNGYMYFVRTIMLPPKSSSFLLSVLVDGTEQNGFFMYEVFGQRVDVKQYNGALMVSVPTNLSLENKYYTINLKASRYTETAEVHIVQEYTHLHLSLKSFVSSGLYGEDEGDINQLTYDHDFHWLTQKTSIDSENIKFFVKAIGPRNGFYVKRIKEYAYAGLLDWRFIYSPQTHKYYEIVQEFSGGELHRNYVEVIYNQYNGSVYREVNYNDDLKIEKFDDSIIVTNYGRCFMQDDAYYVITLANADDSNVTATITINYVSDGTIRRDKGDILVNPSIQMEDGCVVLYTENSSNANNHFMYYVSFVNGQLVYSTDMPQTISNRIENNELIVDVRDGI